MRYKATPHEVCGFVTQIASDVGSIANSRNDPTFHDPRTNSNHPAEPFLQGMHNLARGCPSKRRLPRVRSPRVIHSCRECIWQTWLRLGS
jgi:hypothetical protein